MNPEHYIFDNVGLYHRKNVLPIDVIDTINKKIDSNFTNKGDETFKHDYANIERDTSFADPLALKLIFHKEITELCKVCFSNTAFKLSYSFILNENEPKIINNNISLHGQAYGFQGGWYYTSGSQAHINTPCLTYTGQLSIGIVLKPQDISSGGFCYIPGTHKSAYHISGGDVINTPGWTQRLKEYVTVPSLQPGDFIAFPENLVHGTTSCKLPRRMLYAMFLPYSISYGYVHENIEKYKEYANKEQLSYFYETTRQNTLMDIHLKVSNGHPWSHPKSPH